MIVDGLMVAGLVVLLLALFVTLSGALWLLERASPRFSRWLDRKIGEEPTRDKGW